MTKISGDRYIFSPAEIENCRAHHGKDGDVLKKFFQEKCNGYDLSKSKLLKVLSEFMLNNSNKESDERSIVKVIQKVIKLASMNHQPIRLDDWQSNQESGYFGDPTTKKK